MHKRQASGRDFTVLHRKRRSRRRSASIRSCLDSMLRFSEPVEEPFFAIVGRDSAQLFLKAVSDDL